MIRKINIKIRLYNNDKKITKRQNSCRIMFEFEHNIIDFVIFGVKKEKNETRKWEFYKNTFQR
jgi:hypothetical protein